MPLAIRFWNLQHFGLSRLCLVWQKKAVFGISLKFSRMMYRKRSAFYALSLKLLCLEVELNQMNSPLPISETIFEANIHWIFQHFLPRMKKKSRKEHTKLLHTMVRHLELREKHWKTKCPFRQVLTELVSGTLTVGQRKKSPSWSARWWRLTTSLFWW